MYTNLTFHSLAALFAAMTVLAAVPSVSVLAVTARSAASGFLHGLYTTLGIVVGDIVFIFIAIFGLSFLAESWSGLFILLKYLGATYLIGLGILLWRANGQAITVSGVGATASPWSSFLAGLLITLGDQKAIFFYLGFLPAFVDLSTLTRLDTVLLVATATVTLLGVKLVYAGLAARAGLHFAPGIGQWMNRAAGGVLVAVGLYLLAKG